MPTRYRGGGGGNAEWARLGEDRERDVLKYLKDSMLARHIMFIRLRQQNVRFVNGVLVFCPLPEHELGAADVIIFPTGRQAIAIETKSRKGIHAEDQKKWRARWEKSGRKYYLVRTPEELDAII